MPTPAIIVVHGRSQQFKDPVQLENDWEAALRRGLADVGAPRVPERDQILCPYYGDLYNEYSLAVRQPLTVEEKRKRVRFERQIAGEVEARLVAQRKLTRMAAATPTDAAAKWYDPALIILDKVPGMSGPFLKLVFRDVYDYLHDVGGLRERTMGRVLAPILANQSKRVIVIAHSLGSIVTYDVLNTHPSLRVDLLVTIGSPLGIDKAVRPRLLADPAGKRGVPLGVQAWINAADTDDIVALDETLADDFGRGRPSLITDVVVKNPKASPHSGTGYISQKKVCQRMAQVL